mgnify:CR=1 FL=1
MFPYNEYLQLAKQWATASDEASLRCSVSRAYYACFHLIKVFAEKDGKIFKTDGVAHKEVVDFLKNNLDPNIKMLGVRQDRLRNRRTACDYEKTIKNISGCTKACIMDADSIFNEIKVLV